MELVPVETMDALDTIAQMEARKVELSRSGGVYFGVVEGLKQMVIYCAIGQCYRAELR